MYHEDENLSKGYPWPGELDPSNRDNPYRQEPGSWQGVQHPETQDPQVPNMPLNSPEAPSQLGEGTEPFVADAPLSGGTAPEEHVSGQEQDSENVPPPMGGMTAPYPPGYTWEQSATGVESLPTPDEEEPPMEEMPPLAAPGKKKKKKRPSNGKTEKVSLSAKEKKLAKKNKKKKSKVKKRQNSLLAIKLLAFVLFGVVVGVQGLERVEAANALVGSTALPPSITETQNPVVVDPTTPDTETGDVEAEGPQYKYIDVRRLESKTPTDLAVWYMQEFPEDKAKNENAFEEFQTWYESMKEQDSSFDSKFKEAMAYVEQHPELLEPPVEETPEPDDSESETPTDPNATDVDGPISGDNGENQNQGNSSNGTNNGANTGSSGSTGGTNSGTSSGSNSNSAYQHIDEAALNGFSAAQVANWVLNNFPPNGANWDYQALGEYYDWLDDKGKKDATFVATVNGYLQTMGWSGSAG